MTFLDSDFHIHSGQVKSGPDLLRYLPDLHTAARLRLPDVPSKGLDALGITQRKLNGNFMSWMNDLSDQDKHEGSLWYPTGNDWGHHASELHNTHPDKVFGVMSKTSPQRAWYDNLEDTENIVGNHRYSPHDIVKPGGISGRDNLRQSMRVMDAHDDPDSIHAAFLGTKNAKRKGESVAIPRTPGDLPKTYDFMRTLRNPEEGGAGNYMHQPGVADSWMSRSMLWSKKAWDEAQAGGKPLHWPGQGTGEGLDKHLPVKKPNPNTGQWEVVGSKPPSARDVAARVTGMGGGYDRMRNAMRYGAAAHDMPFTHGAQAAVWKSISGNQNPSGVPNRDVDPFYIEHPGQRWDEMWNRRASGMHVPVNSGIQVARRTAAHGDPFEVEDSLDEGWGTPKDIQDILRHISSIPRGWDVWEDRPAKLVPVDLHEQQRMGPHPHQASWYIDAAQWLDGPNTSEAHTSDGQKLKVRHPWEENPHYEWQHYHDSRDRPATGVASSLDEGKAAAEQSHKDLSGAWDPDSEQDALDPRLLGAGRDIGTGPARFYPGPTRWRKSPRNKTLVDTKSRWGTELEVGDSPDIDLSEPDVFDPRSYQAARYASQYFADTDGLDVPLDSGEKKKDPDVAAAGPVGSPAGLNNAKGSGDIPFAAQPIKQYVQPGGGMGGGGGGGGMPSSGGGGGGSPVAYTPSSGVDQWKQDVEMGLQRNGLPTSLENQVMKQIGTESSGNPNAINNTDSNAVAGHPSQGLLQTIPSTFNTYHLPGDSANIDDPQANIDSAIGYAKSTYGPTLMNSEGHGMGSGTGY